MDLKTRYKVKGIGAEKVIESVIKIHTDEKGERIVGVEDRWNGNIPEGAIATVCSEHVFELLQLMFLGAGVGRLEGWRRIRLMWFWCRLSAILTVLLSRHS